MTLWQEGWGREVGVILFASLWRITYGNRYVNHPLLISSAYLQSQSFTNGVFALYNNGTIFNLLSNGTDLSLSKTKFKYQVKSFIFRSLVYLWFSCNHKISTTDTSGFNKNMWFFFLVFFVSFVSSYLWFCVSRFLFEV